MSTPPEAQREGRGGKGAFVLAIAALAACWNPLAAPAGLLVGIAAAVLAVRALRRAATRRLPAVALAIGVLATLASAVMLSLTAGVVSTDLPGEPVVKTRTQAELDQVLAQAAERTRPQRERASRELDRLAGPEEGASRALGAPAPDAGVPRKARP